MYFKLQRAIAQSTKGLASVDSFSNVLSDTLKWLGLSNPYFFYIIHNKKHSNDNKSNNNYNYNNNFIFQISFILYF